MLVAAAKYQMTLKKDFLAELNDGILSQDLSSFARVSRASSGDEAELLVGS